MGKKEVVLGGQGTTNVNTGSKTAQTTAAALSSDNRVLKWGVQIVADGGNANNIYVGVRPNLTAGSDDETDGVKLPADSGIFIPAGKESDVYVISDGADQVLTFLSY